MSVINKMLRDLDSRQAAGAIPGATAELRTGIARDTLVVDDSEWSGFRPGQWRWVLIAALVMALGGAAGVWWYLNQNALPSRGVPAGPVIATVPTPAPAAVVPLRVPIQTPAPVAPALPLAAPMKSVVANVSLKIDNTLSQVPGADNAVQSIAAEAPSRKPERPQTRRPTTLAASSPAIAPSVSTNSPRQSAALEVLAQAQSLWNSGSHLAAIDLASQALTVAERANAADPSANNSVLASLARELARMLLAEGRVSQALEMLTRLEPALSGAADVWAIRGNAAQRLGRHAESTAAYQMALKLRPNEPRWMLGAAVSLAAQGQTVAAAELAERARSGGVLSLEVASYLRQLGVILPER